MADLIVFIVGLVELGILAFVMSFCVEIGFALADRVVNRPPRA